MQTQHVPRRQPTPPERSPEERARAAAERAARRGENAPPPETFSARNAQPPEPAAPSEDPFRVERARPEPEPEPEPAVEGSWFDEEPELEPEPEPEPEPERDAMPEDPFPQATQEFQPAWVEEDDDVAWETPEPVAPVSREPAQPPQRRPRAATRRPVPPRGPRTALSNPRSNGRRPHREGLRADSPSSSRIRRRGPLRPDAVALPSDRKSLGTTPPLQLTTR